MFPRLQRALAPTGVPTEPHAIDVPSAFSTSGVADLLGELGGAVFAGGAYRVHDPALVPRWTQLAVEAFPQLTDAVLCFASDWLGRQFAVAAEAASAAGGRGVVLIDLHSDEVLELAGDLGQFHDELLAERPDAILALDLLANWQAGGGEIPRPSECVDFKVPLYLGGSRAPANMAILDLEVTWGVAAQLLRQVRRLPPGTRISDVRIT